MKHMDDCIENIDMFCSDMMREKIISSYKIDYAKNREMHIDRVDNGIVHPCEITECKEVRNYGGVTDEKLNFIKSSCPLRFIGEGIFPVVDWLIGANPTKDFTRIKYIDEDVVYLGPIKGHIAHFYIETFCRLWFFLHGQNSQYRIVYTTQKGENINWRVLGDFFDGLGIDRRRLWEISEPTKFKTVIVPEQSCELNGQYSPIYIALFDELKSKCRSLGYEKVYLSKKKCTTFYPRCANWNIVDKIFAENGYKVLYPEDMTINDTISALNGCHEVVMQSGSNAYNAVFADNGSQIVVLNRSAHVHPYQTIVDKMRKFRSVYVDVFYPNLPVPWDCGPFGFFFTDYLQRYFDKYHINYATFNNSEKIIKLNQMALAETLRGWTMLFGTEFYSK